MIEKFENLYKNIGKKIKKLAKAAFIVETIAAVITGLALMFTDEDFILFGLLTLLFGPIFAWISSWILYAFGELVEKTCDNEYNTRTIAKLLQKNDTENEESTIHSPITPDITKKEIKKPIHMWRCNSCDNMRSQSPCEHCGKD